MTVQSLEWTPISGSEKSCIVSSAGAQGKIFSNYCPATLDFNQEADIAITCKNTGTASGIFALLFCASSPPFTACDVKSYVSDAFTLDPNATKDFTISITMPNNQILYVATIQRANPEWITDDTVPCSINLTSAPPAIQGKITSNNCPDSLVSGQSAGIMIRCENIGLLSGLFKLVFCAFSSSPDNCDVSQPIPEEFTLNPGMIRDIPIFITMPNSPISYNATLQHQNPLDTSWATDDTVSCDISLTSQPPAEAGGSGILFIGLALGALVMMMSKKKQKQ